MKALLFNDMSLPTPLYARKPPIRVHNIQDSYIAFDELTSEQVLVLSRLRTEGELPEMAGNQ